MKKLLYLFVLVFSSTAVLAQDFTLVYEPENHDDYIVVRDISTTSDDHLLVGYDLQMASGMPAAGIMKTDMDGAVVWSKTLDIHGSVAGCTFEVAENAEGNFYLWGLSKEAETDHMRAILSEITADGEMLWSKEYDFGTNATTTYTINKLQVMPSGDLQMMIAVFSKVIVMKTDADGNIIWAKASAMGPPDEGGKNPGFEWLAIPDDGGMCASKAENDFSLLRYSEEGELLWNRAYSLGGYTHCKTIARSPNGNILVAGFIDYNLHIMELSDEEGDINWVKTFADVSLAFLGKAHLSVIDDEIILDYVSPTYQQYIVTLNEDGEVLEAMRTKHAVLDYNKILFENEHETYLYGSMQNEDLSYDGVIHRTASVMEETCMIESFEAPTTVDFLTFSEVDFTPYEEDFTNEEPIEVALVDQQMRVKYACDVVLSDGELIADNTISVYPNPSTDNITVNLPEALLNATYVITDLSGKQVITDSVVSTQMQIDLSELSNGQYILSVQTENEIITEKITVIK